MSEEIIVLSRLNINSLPDDVEYIEFPQKNLITLPNLSRFKNLKHLIIRANELTSLPNLPDSLEALHCEYNKLEYLPTLPKKLKILYCSGNRLKTLPKLPEGLTYLRCSQNKLTCIKNLPNSLIELQCQHNQITNIRHFPENLRSVICSQNKLTSLPTLPRSLLTLDCFCNDIIIIQNFNANYTLIDVNIRCNPIINIIGPIKTRWEKHLRILNKFRFSYYCIRHKVQFIKWLWKCREKTAMKKYHPSYLIEMIKDEETDLDEVLEEWIK